MSAASGKFIRGSGVVALGAASAMVLAACAETGGGSGPGGDGVEFGATIEEYHEAFADIDPIRINTQVPAAQGAATGANFERYFEAIEEWSDGKITFEIGWANSVANPGEADDALRDGRLDLASVLPIYEPSDYPANAALIEAGFISDQSVVPGALQSNAWPNQVAFDTAEIIAEFEDNGMVPLVPIFNSGVNVLFCGSERTDLSELSGMTSASGGTAQSKQVEALGGSASSVAFPEIFESLQRGVVDCSVSSFIVGVLGGFIPEAPNVIADPEAGFAFAPGALAFSKSTWDTLPLVAQQLFWDRLDVYIESNITEKIWPVTAEAVSAVKENGGVVQAFASDARAALQAANEDLLDELREASGLDGDALVEGSLAAADEWSQIIAELGYGEFDVEYQDFDELWEGGDAIDLDAYIERLFDEVFLPHRPS